jgi:hypothetical protein
LRREEKRGREKGLTAGDAEVFAKDAEKRKKTAAVQLQRSKEREQRSQRKKESLEC